MIGVSMRTTINVPDSLYRLAERAAKNRGVTVEELIAATFESVAAAELEGVAPRGQVKLHLIRSKSPGSLDLSDYNFDDLLA
jgi:hypothetical protein